MIWETHKTWPCPTCDPPDLVRITYCDGSCLRGTPTSQCEWRHEDVRPADVDAEIGALIGANWHILLVEKR